MPLRERVRWWFKRYGAMRIIGLAFLLLCVACFVVLLPWLIAGSMREQARRVEAEREFIRKHTVMKVGDKSFVKFTTPDGAVCNAVVRDLSGLDPRNTTCVGGK